MANDYYTHGSFPATGAAGASAPMRAELESITAGFGKLPALSGNGNKAVVVNAGGTGLTVTTGQLALAGNLTISGAFNTTFVAGASVVLTLPTGDGTLARTSDPVTDISGGGAGQVLYQIASGQTGFSTTGTAGQALLSGGAASPTWTTGTLALAGNLAFTGANNVVFATVGNYTYTLPAASGTLGLQGGGGGNADNIAGGTAGKILYQSAVDTTSFSSQGSSGQALLSGGIGAPTWTTGALALAGNFSTTGAFNLTLAQTASITLTLPNSSQTIATLGGSETLTNKTLSSPTIANFSNATHDHSNSSNGGTLAIGDINGHNRTLHDGMGTGTVVYTQESQTLTNKTLTSAILTSPTIGAGQWSSANHTHAAGNEGGQISITSATTGTLTVSRGGTGVGSLTNHGVVLGAGASALNATSAGTAGQFLQSQGPTADPTWADVLPSGTLMLFQQTSAPTGWTKQVTHNDKSLRVVSGTAGSGGATAFSSVFGSSKVTGSHTLTNSEIQGHTHTIDAFGGDSGVCAVGTARSHGCSAGANGTHTSSSTGGGGSHDHTLSLDLHYVDVIIASKD